MSWRSTARWSRTGLRPRRTGSRGGQGPCRGPAPRRRARRPPASASPGSPETRSSRVRRAGRTRSRGSSPPRRRRRSYSPPGRRGWRAGSPRRASSSPSAEDARRRRRARESPGRASFLLLRRGRGHRRVRRRIRAAGVADELVHQRARLGPLLLFLLEVDDRLGRATPFVQRPAVLGVASRRYHLAALLGGFDDARQPGDELVATLRVLVVVVERLVVAAPAVHRALRGAGERPRTGEESDRGRQGSRGHAQCTWMVFVSLSTKTVCLKITLPEVSRTTTTWVPGSTRSTAGRPSYAAASPTTVPSTNSCEPLGAPSTARLGRVSVVRTVVEGVDTQPAIESAAPARSPFIADLRVRVPRRTGSRARRGPPCLPSLRKPILRSSRCPRRGSRPARSRPASAAGQSRSPTACSWRFPIPGGPRACRRGVDPGARLRR